MATKKIKIIPASEPNAAPAPSASRPASARQPSAVLTLDLPDSGPAARKGELAASAPVRPAAGDETAVSFRRGTPPVAPPVSEAPSATLPFDAPAAPPAGAQPAAPQGPAAGREQFQLGLNEPDNPQRVLEAALFMSGQAIGAAELAKLVGIAALGHVNEQLSQLSARYETAGSALEVVQEENGKWVMRVRASYASSVRNFAGEAEISRHALRTLAYISKNEGIKKRDLFMRLGSTIYDDVAELLDKGFVSAAPAGRTVSLKTTAKFKQYFEG